MKVAVQVLLTICLDIKVDDNMVLGDLDVVDLVSIDVLQSSVNVRPSELRSSRRPCLLSRALHELLVEKGLFLIEVEGVWLFWRGFELWIIEEVASESRIDIPEFPILMIEPGVELLKVVLELFSEYISTLRIWDVALTTVFLIQLVSHSKTNILLGLEEEVILLDEVIEYIRPEHHVLRLISIVVMLT